MFKTAFFLLCSVAILVSGDNDAVTSLPNPVTDSKSTTNEKIENVITSSTTSTLPTPTTTTSVTNVSTTLTPTLPPPTTPSPSPTPVPLPSTGKWVVNGTNETCIIVQMALQFNITYITNENKTAYKLLDLPASNDTRARGICGVSADLEQNITLSWNSTVSNGSLNNLTIHFVKNVTNHQYSLHHLEVSLAPGEFPKIQTNYSTSFMYVSNQFTAGLKNSYRCLKSQTFNLTNAKNDTRSKITVSNLQFQAFHGESTTSFGFAEDCAFDTPDIVPIAVGCALATLVVIVLIAYLVGRRRSQAHGYLSM